jgi:hypothetical protein
MARLSAIGGNPWSVFLISIKTLLDTSVSAALGVGSAVVTVRLHRVVITGLGVDLVIGVVADTKGGRCLFFVINVDQLETRFENGQDVTLAELKKAFSLSRKVEVKILGRGQLTRSLTVSANSFSASAELAITNAGGSVIRV